MTQGAFIRQMTPKVNILNTERAPTVHKKKSQPHIKMYKEIEQAVF